MNRDVAHALHAFLKSHSCMNIEREKSGGGGEAWRYSRWEGWADPVRSAASLVDRQTKEEPMQDERGKKTE